MRDLKLAHILVPLLSSVCKFVREYSVRYNKVRYSNVQPLSIKSQYHIEYHIRSCNESRFQS